MKTSSFVGMLAVVGAGAVSVGAADFPLSPFYGSDAEANLQNGAIKLSGLGNPGTDFSDFTGGGSGLAEGAMAVANPTLFIGPMTTMLASATCGVSLKTHATGIAIGLDAVNLYAGPSSGGAAACNGVNESVSSDNTGAGLNYDAAIPDAAAGPNNIPFSNWTDVLALLYGGLDKVTKVTDCNSAKRQALVANWSNLYQNKCSNNNSTCTTGSFNSTTKPGGGFKIGGQLWHAFRADDSLGTPNAFASLIGLGTITATNSGTKYLSASVSSSGPTTSTGTNAGYGVSPFCNVINWDTSTANGAKAVGSECELGHNRQYVGPGGVPQGICSNNAVSRNNVTGFSLANGVGFGCDVVGAASTCSDGTTCGVAAQTTCVDGSACLSCTCVAVDAVHKRPPYLTWGTVADSSVANPFDGLTNAAVALPASYQDNDPIRRPCLGLAGDITDNPGEEVCNRDGTLGVVLPISPLDVVPASLQFPNPGTNAVNGNSLGTSAFNVFACALIAGNAGLAPGGCPNGDTTFGSGCIAATVDNSNTNVYAGPNDSQTLGNYTVYDGRIYNLTYTNGGAGYENFKVPAVSATFGYAFSGGYTRIHQSTVLWDTTASSTGLAAKGVACNVGDANLQLGCLVQADPCSVSVSSDTAATWCDQDPGLCTSAPYSGNTLAQDPVRLRISQIQATTTTIRNGSYDLWRKIYLNDSLGFDRLSTIVATDGGASPVAQLELAEFESNTASISNLLTTYAFFTFGNTAPNGANAPFCEDFNEQMLCDAGFNNNNACSYNTTNVNFITPLGGDAGAFSPIPGTDSGLAPDAVAATIPPGNQGGSTVCGNGIVEQFEDCDNGPVGNAINAYSAELTAGYTVPCSNTCRFIFP
jgi:hypothetical protein